jgi:asparagine synthetase B (glutamine-hydrolysing)
MAADARVVHLGAFAVFGLVHHPEHLLKRKLLDRLGAIPRTIDFGPAGCFFLYTSYGDMAETGEAIALKLGFVRTPAMSPLSAQQLLDQRVVSPKGIDSVAMRGNGLVACFGRVEARFSVFKTLLSGPPLYYSVSGDGILCSDRLGCLIDLLDRLELDESAIPQHFLLLGTLGSRTYYRNVKRLRPGESLEWNGASLKVRLVKDLRSLKADSTFGGIDTRSPAIYQWLKDLVGAYISDIQASRSDFGNLLSGGVDSSVTQLLINEHITDAQPRSFSYLVHAPSFEPEVGYARRAQAAFMTEHTFIDILPRDYPDLLVRSIGILGQPVQSAMEPCKLAVAEFLANESSSPHCYFVALGADLLFGSPVAQKLRWLDIAGQVPASALILDRAGRLLRPFTAQGQRMLKAAMILKDPNHLVAPINTIGISANFDFALRCFGAETVEEVLELRRRHELEYLNSHCYQEKVHIVGLLYAALGEISQSQTLFLANGKRLVCQFMDEDAIRVSFAVRPEQRYIRGRRVKPILKDILEEKSSSSAARLPKLGSSFNPDLYAWMDSGPLHEMVMNIERPGFLTKPDFERLLERPNYYFLWALLTFDTFSKRFLKRRIFAGGRGVNRELVSC